MDGALFMGLFDLWKFEIALFLHMGYILYKTSNNHCPNAA